MGAFYESGAFVSESERETHSAFWSQTEVWYAAWCAKRGVPSDSGELELAKDTVFSWLVATVTEQGAEGLDELDATDLPYVWLNAHFPEGLDADRMITALIEWVTWLGECGLFRREQTSRFVGELSSTRESFVTWSRAEEPLSASPEGQDAVSLFSWWLREHRHRCVSEIIVGQAAMTAAINLMGEVEGDLRTLDLNEWLQRTAYVLIEDAHEPAIRTLVDDVIQWFGVRGKLTLRERKRMHRAVAEVHQQLVRQAQFQAWEQALSEAS